MVDDEDDVDVLGQHKEVNITEITIFIGGAIFIICYFIIPRSWFNSVNNTNHTNYTNHTNSTNNTNNTNNTIHKEIIIAFISFAIGITIGPLIVNLLQYYKKI